MYLTKRIRQAEDTGRRSKQWHEARCKRARAIRKSSRIPPRRRERPPRLAPQAGRHATFRNSPIRQAGLVCHRSGKADLLRLNYSRSSAASRHEFYGGSAVQAKFQPVQYWSIKSLAATTCPFRESIAMKVAGVEIASNQGDPFPPQNHHRHNPQQGPIRWRPAVYADHRPKYASVPI